MATFLGRPSFFGGLGGFRILGRPTGFLTLGGFSILGRPLPRLTNGTAGSARGAFLGDPGLFSLLPGVKPASYNSSLATIGDAYQGCVIYTLQLQFA